MKRTLSLLLIVAISGVIHSQDNRLQKINDDDNSKWTNVGNIGLTMTNFGMLGSGWMNWQKNQPSCEYPLGSRIEHLFAGGLWIGAFLSNDSLSSGRSGPFVTTAALDVASISTSRGGGFEFTNSAGSIIRERSSFLDSKLFSPYAISHQDFLMEFTDTNRRYLGGELIPDHSPLGVSVRQETYAWDFSFANNFVILNYWIKNVSPSGKYLDSIYIGLWNDIVVRNTTITPPGSGGSNFYNKTGIGVIDSNLFKIFYGFDYSGDVGATDSYLGVQFLGSDRKIDSTNFVFWLFRNVTDVELFAPQTDVARYNKMSGYFAGQTRLKDMLAKNATIMRSPSNRAELFSIGPIRNLKPGDSVNVVFAYVAAKKYGGGDTQLDTREQKTNLLNSAEWALRAFYGNDRNRNGRIEPEEDIFGDGKLHQYILPTPPNSPKVKVVPSDRKVEIYWDKRAEASVDPILGTKDFEGYNLYRTNPGYDLGSKIDILGSLVEMASFDSSTNSIGFNTGFSKIRLAQPVVIEQDTFYYKFEVDNQLNGWQYIYSVTAFDKGDPTYNLSSLESSPLTTANTVIPGTRANSGNSEIGVYPNPYYGAAYWDGSSERLRKIYFYNLPETCEITIYTLAGDVVKRIQHDKNSNGSDTRWFQTYATDGKQKMAGGEHAWDLVTDNDQAIATGLYLFSVKNANDGTIKTGKFLIIK